MKNLRENIIPTLDLLIPGGKNFHKWEAKSPELIGFIKDSCFFIHKNTLYKTTYIDGKFTRLKFLSLKELNNQLEKRHLSSTKSFPNAKIISSENTDIAIILETDKFSIKLNPDNKTIEVIRILDKEWKNRNYLSPDGDFICTYNNNIWEITPKESFQITFENKSEVQIGEIAHRNEWNINKGVFLSPSRKKVAFYRIDSTNEATYFFPDSFLPLKKQQKCKYPFSGGENPSVTIGITDLITLKTLYLETPSPREYFYAGITWDKNETFLYVTEIERTQQYARLCRYNSKTGELEKILIEERSSKYIEPLHSPLLLYLSQNEKYIVWASRRNGWEHLYLYDYNGKKIRQLTNGKWEITQIIGTDWQNNILYLSTETSPLDQCLYSISLNGLKTRLSPINSVISKIMLCPAKTNIVYEYSAPNYPKRLEWINLPSSKTHLLFKSPKPFFHIQIIKEGEKLQHSLSPQLYVGTIISSDNKTPLYYRLCLPSRFDNQTKYPVIQYVYGGPHIQLIDNSWLNKARGWELYMAEKGYITFTLDPRGSEHRGRSFEQSIFRHLGTPTDKDLITGIEWLRQQSYVDTSKIGIHGWSFGGYMTLRLLMNYPEYFKAGVAGGAVTNWEWYEIMYTERYMQTPEKNPRGYRKTNLTQQAHLLKKPLLLLHGEQDPVVLPQHLYQFLKSCITAGKYPSIFTYPGHKHNIEGKDRVHLFQIITHFFENNL